MIYSIIKKWAIVAFYLFVATLIDGYCLDTLLLPIPELFNQTHVYLLLASLCISLFLHFWEMSLPVLNNYYQIILFLFGLIALLVFQLLSPEHMYAFHIILMLGILSWQIIVYHSYNKPFTKDQPKPRGRKYIVVLVITLFFYGVYSYSNENVVLKYQNAYPSRQEVIDDLQWDCSFLDLEVNYSTKFRADNINAKYSLKHPLFHYIESDLMVKGHSKSSYQYEFYEEIKNGRSEYYSFVKEQEDISIYQNNSYFYSEYYGKNTSSVITIYENDNIIVYTRFDIMYDGEIDYDQLIKEINAFHDYFRSFSY